jgi:GT2 family glycosyltransferase
VSVSVVIPNWNGAHFLPVVLESLERQTHRDFTVVVVDNGSSDGSLELLARDWPQVEVVALPENRGFAPAVNAGIRATHGNLVALVNNDLELDAGWLAAAVRALEAEPAAGSVTGKMLSFRERDLIDDAGDGYTWYGVGFARGRGERDSGQYDAPGDVLSACGGAALYRRSAFTGVGLFDERFFAYMEDLDWGFRAQLRGWSCRYEPAAVSFHIGAGTSSTMGDLARYLTVRNGIWLVVKNFPIRALVRHAHRIGLYLAATAVRGERASLRGMADALRALPAVLRERRSIQSGARIGYSELEHRLAWEFPTDSALFGALDSRLLRGGSRS